MIKEIILISGIGLLTGGLFIYLLSKVFKKLFRSRGSWKRDKIAKDPEKILKELNKSGGFVDEGATYDYSIGVGEDGKKRLDLKITPSKVQKEEEKKEEVEKGGEHAEEVEEAIEEAEGIEGEEEGTPTGEGEVEDEKREGQKEIMRVEEEVRKVLKEQSSIDKKVEKICKFIDWDKEKLKARMEELGSFGAKNRGVIIKEFLTR